MGVKLSSSNQSCAAPTNQSGCILTSQGPGAGTPAFISRLPAAQRAQRFGRKPETARPSLALKTGDVLLAQSGPAQTKQKRGRGGGPLRAELPP